MTKQPAQPPDDQIIGDIVVRCPLKGADMGAIAAELKELVQELQKVSGTKAHIDACLIKLMKAKKYRTVNARRSVLMEIYGEIKAQKYLLGCTKPKLTMWCGYEQDGVHGIDQVWCGTEKAGSVDGCPCKTPIVIVEAKGGASALSELANHTTQMDIRWVRKKRKRLELKSDICRGKCLDRGMKEGTPEVLGIVIRNGVPITSDEYESYGKGFSRRLKTEAKGCLAPVLSYEPTEH